MTNDEIDSGFWQSRAIEWDENKRRTNLANTGSTSLMRPKFLAIRGNEPFRRDIRPMNAATSHLALWAIASSPLSGPCAEKN